MPKTATKEQRKHAREAAVGKVTEAIDQACKDLPLDDYALALAEILTYVEASMDAAGDDIKRRDRT